MLTEEDLVYIFCITKKVKINWIHLIKEHMQKAMRLGDYHYPYAVLISKFLHYFEVNLETFELVKSTQELNNGSLSKMGFTKIGGKWLSKDGDHGASSSGAAHSAIPHCSSPSKPLSLQSRFSPSCALLLPPKVRFFPP